MSYPDSSVGRICLQRRRPQLDSWVGKICWRRDSLSTPVFLGFPCGSAGKESACNEGDLGSVCGLGRSPGEGKSSPLQCSGLENSIDCIVPGVANSRTQLSNFHFTSLHMYVYVCTYTCILTSALWVALGQAKQFIGRQFYRLLML